MSIKSYKQYIDRCEVVSFDVFDTLIKRNVRTPKDVFSLVEREALKRFGVSMEGFRDKRVCAERTARELSDREEISFGINCLMRRRLNRPYRSWNWRWSMR